MHDSVRKQSYGRNTQPACAVRTNSLRGDGVGVGDIVEVPGIAGVEGDAAGGDDGGGAGRERDTGVVGGRGDDERD